MIGKVKVKRTGRIVTVTTVSLNEIAYGENFQASNGMFINTSTAGTGLRLITVFLDNTGKSSSDSIFLGSEEEAKEYVEKLNVALKDFSKHIDFKKEYNESIPMIKFAMARHGTVVMFKILEMSESLRNRARYTAKNGIEIASVSEPEIRPDIIYLRGDHTGRDNLVVEFDFENEVAASNYIARAKEALGEFIALERERAQQEATHPFVSDIVKFILCLNGSKVSIVYSYLDDEFRGNLGLLDEGPIYLRSYSHPELEIDTVWLPGDEKDRDNENVSIQLDSPSMAKEYFNNVIKAFTNWVEEVDKRNEIAF